MYYTKCSSSVYYTLIFILVCMCVSVCACRLVSLSYGCHELSLDHWHYTKQLEAQRVARQSPV